MSDGLPHAAAFTTAPPASAPATAASGCIRNHEGYDPGQRARAAQRLRPGRPGRRHHLAVRHAHRQARESALVLNGTDNNCNGGPTPWGSWLSCEESTVGPLEGFEKKHGYVFEVPFGSRQPVDPVPIKAMGRFEHEACAIDPRTGIVYMTEDNGDPADGFYRYLPHHPRPAAPRRHAADAGGGGALALRHLQAPDGRPEAAVRVGDIEIPIPPTPRTTPTRCSSRASRRALRSSWASRGPTGRRAACTSLRVRPATQDEGQIWRYTPVGHKHGVLVLLYESKSKTVLDQPDSLAVSPRGGIVVCEDGDGEDVNGGTNYLRCLTPAGNIETFARNDTPLDLHRWEDAPEGVGRAQRVVGRDLQPRWPLALRPPSVSREDLCVHGTVGERVALELGA